MSEWPSEWVNFASIPKPHVWLTSYHEVKRKETLKRKSQLKDQGEETYFESVDPWFELSTPPPPGSSPPGNPPREFELLKISSFSFPSPLGPNCVQMPYSSPRSDDKDNISDRCQSINCHVRPWRHFHLSDSLMEVNSFAIHWLESKDCIHQWANLSVV